METVTVKDVEKNSAGWYEITLENDDRTVSTKNQKLADAAFASRGTPVEAEINSRKNGSFENHYLNKFGDVSDTRAGGNGGGRPRSGGGKSPQEQNTIAQQWAIGRAVELLLGSEEAIAFPLNDEQLSALQMTAQSLFTLRGKIT